MRHKGYRKNGRIILSKRRTQGFILLACILIPVVAFIGMGTMSAFNTGNSTLAVDVAGITINGQVLSGFSSSAQSIRIDANGIPTVAPSDRSGSGDCPLSLMIGSFRTQWKDSMGYNVVGDAGVANPYKTDTYGNYIHEYYTILVNLVIGTEVDIVQSSSYFSYTPAISGSNSLPITGLNTFPEVKIQDVSITLHFGVDLITTDSGASVKINTVAMEPTIANTVYMELTSGGSVNSEYTEPYSIYDPAILPDGGNTKSTLYMADNITDGTVATTLKIAPGAAYEDGTWKTRDVTTTLTYTLDVEVISSIFDKAEWKISDQLAFIPRNYSWMDVQNNMFLYAMIGLVLLGCVIAAISLAKVNLIPKSVKRNIFSGIYAENQGGGGYRSGEYED